MRQVAQGILSYGHQGRDRPIAHWAQLLPLLLSSRAKAGFLQTRNTALNLF